MYSKGTVLTGLVTIPLFTYKGFHDKSITPLKSKTFGEFTSAYMEDREISCAEKIVLKSCTTIVYPARKIAETETGCKILSAFVGTAQGTGLAFTWPVVLPLVGLHMAEQKLNWKLC